MSFYAIHFAVYCLNASLNGFINSVGKKTLVLFARVVVILLSVRRNFLFLWVIKKGLLFYCTLTGLHYTYSVRGTSED